MEKERGGGRKEDIVMSVTRVTCKMSILPLVRGLFGRLVSLEVDVVESRLSHVWPLCPVSVDVHSHSSSAVTTVPSSALQALPFSGY